MEGIDLKIERVRSGVKAKDLAAVLGVSAARVYQVEQCGCVGLEWSERYVAGLRELVAKRNVVDDLEV